MSEKNKISVRQLFLLLIIANLSPAIRLFPRITGKIAKQAAWLTPIVASAVSFLLVYIIHNLFKNNQKVGLSEVIYKTFGKIFGKGIVAVYLVWIFTLTNLYIRYYAERKLGSGSLTTTSINFYLLIMLALVFYVARNGIVSLARANELFFIVIILIFFVLSIISFSEIKITNIWPISVKDIKPILSGSTCIMSIMAYGFFIFFLGDKVKGKEKILKIGVKWNILQTVMTISIIIGTIGTLSSQVAKRIPLPYFVAVKNLSLGTFLQRFESAVVAVWAITDFVIISLFMMITVSIIKSLFNLADAKSLVTPVILLSYGFTGFFANNVFQLEMYTETILATMNILLGLIFPIVIFAVGKLRKTI